MRHYRILTYNVFWKNMIQKPECAININKLLNTLKSFDFILLQEVANQMILLKRLNKKYNIIEHISGRETMTTLIDKKYNISQTLFGQFNRKSDEVFISDFYFYI